MFVYCEFKLCKLAMDSILAVNSRSLSMRSSSRKKKNMESEVDASTSNLGYHSFKRGDVVTWVGGSDVELECDVREVVFGCLVFNHRNQQRRYLITYARAESKFSINAWTSWTHVPLIGK